MEQKIGNYNANLKETGDINSILVFIQDIINNMRS